MERGPPNTHTWVCMGRERPRAPGTLGEDKGGGKRARLAGQPHPAVPHPSRGSRNHFRLFCRRRSFHPPHEVGRHGSVCMLGVTDRALNRLAPIPPGPHTRQETHPSAGTEDHTCACRCPASAGGQSSWGHEREEARAPGAVGLSDVGSRQQWHPGPLRGGRSPSQLTRRGCSTRPHL